MRRRYSRWQVDALKIVRSLFWVLFTLGTLFLAALYLPLFWYLDLRGKQQRKEKIAWGFAHWWGRVVLWATGSKVKVSGIANIPPGPVVVMGNHQSYFDIMLMLGYVEKPLSFIAKKELIKVPLISPWMTHLGCLFLDRRDVRQASQIFQLAVKKVQGGWSMVIFPEGTRSRSNELGEFKKGSMKLPIRANVPIVPVSIDGTFKIFEGNGNRIGPAKVVLNIFPPIMPQQYPDLDSGQVAEIVRDRVVHGLKLGDLEAAATSPGQNG